MRKIVAGLFISLAGVVEAPDRWHFPYFNQEMAAAVDATLGAAREIVVSNQQLEFSWCNQGAIGVAACLPLVALSALTLAPIPEQQVAQAGPADRR